MMEPAPQPADSHDVIRVQGARVSNPKEVSVALSRRRLTVFTAVSWSGKSSLVLCTIAAASRRRINETDSNGPYGWARARWPRCRPAVAVPSTRTRGAGPLVPPAGVHPAGDPDGAVRAAPPLLRTASTPAGRRANHDTAYRACRRLLKRIEYGPAAKSARPSSGSSASSGMFERPEYRILVVADKFQTGFDQPLLHTMYVDRKLGGATTLLSEASDPNLLYEMETGLAAFPVHTAAGLASLPSARPCRAGRSVS